MRTPGRIPELDGLRAMAILMVIAFHYFHKIPYFGAKLGWLGVDLFFALSGFLITTILLGLKDKRDFFGTFYARRALRIFPPYYVCLAVLLAVSLAAHRPGSVGLWMQFALYYTSLQIGQPAMLYDHAMLNFGVAVALSTLWSLSVEELYYTLWAPVVRFFSRRGIWLTALGMIVIAPVLRWWFHGPQGPELHTFYCRMDALGLGSLVALVHERERLGDGGMRRAGMWMQRAWMVLLPTWTVVAIATRGDESSRVFATFGVSLADAFFASLVYAVVMGTGSNGLPMRMLRWGWLRWIGKVSYTLYLVNFPLRELSTWMVDSAQLRLPGVVLLAMKTLLGAGMSLLVAYLSWEWMESRILRWKDRRVPSAAHVQ